MTLINLYNVIFFLFSSAEICSTATASAAKNTHRSHSAPTAAATATDAVSERERG